MRTKSSLTWRTFGLAVVGLCLACAHAAQGGPHPRQRVAADEPSGPPGQEERGGPPQWVGVGPSRIASNTADPSHSRPSIRRVSLPGGAQSTTRTADTRLSLTAGERQTAIDQARRVQLSQANRPAPAPQRKPAQTPDRRRDPRVERALTRVASGPSLERDAFGGSRAYAPAMPPR